MRFHAATAAATRALSPALIAPRAAAAAAWIGPQTKPSERAIEIRVVIVAIAAPNGMSQERI